MPRTPTFDEVTVTATQPRRHWSNRNFVLFHCFNPNGAYAAKREMDKKITEAVDAGIVPSGWHIAHGSLNDYHTEKLMKISRKMRVSDFESRYHVNRILSDIEEVKAKLKEHYQ